MKIAVSVESTNDLPKEFLDKYDIKVIPYAITMGELEFMDGEYTTEQLLNMVDEKGILPKTTAINEFIYEDFFSSMLKGYDAVIHIALSSGITSSCGNAVNASKKLNNVFVVDSKSLSAGIGMLAIYARGLANKGLSAEEIAEKVTARTQALKTTFVIHKLNYMHKGGRCSGLAVLGANILKIRPRISLDPQTGKMSADRRYRGHMGQVVAKYCSDLFEECKTPNLESVFITYTTAFPEMIEAAQKACKEQGFKNIYETHAGGTIASHCGGNTLGVIFFNDGK